MIVHSPHENNIYTLPINYSLVKQSFSALHGDTYGVCKNMRCVTHGKQKVMILNRPNPWIRH